MNNDEHLDLLQDMDLVVDEFDLADDQENLAIVKSALTELHLMRSELVLLTELLGEHNNAVSGPIGGLNGAITMVERARSAQSYAEPILRAIKVRNGLG